MKVMLKFRPKVVESTLSGTWGSEGLAEVAGRGARIARQERHGEARCQERLGRVRGERGASQEYGLRGERGATKEYEILAT